jgi:hypothetical protein
MKGGRQRTTPWPPCENNVTRESIAQRSQRPQRRNWSGVLSERLPLPVSARRPGLSRAQDNCPPSVWPQPQFPPSVTSVASVRCFSGLAQFSHRGRLVPASSLTPTSISPLCDLRDLCAMLFRFGSILAPRPPSPRQQFGPTSISPLCDLRDLCAMLSLSDIAIGKRDRNLAKRV